MISFTTCEVELVRDAFGILSGQRYEFIIQTEVEEDDELFNDNGIVVRAIYVVDTDREGLVKYDLNEKTTGTYLDFDLEEEEEQALEAYCREHLPEVG
ncbi:DUF6509 family protein [Paenibacillus sp. JX-17]|uniref:DUF6509 family protein n=1 Tax=Paenibacillus lacisoli TaxID=3064525 RepID=A0ABT9CHJ5_9BACL|nr:DUF6509 family protein [Paenibacillus sp. JX-17]MDO7908048.1 DUF6509 family protein [Paenibacillus sp. JX-17]